MKLDGWLRFLLLLSLVQVGIGTECQVFGDCEASNSNFAFKFAENLDAPTVNKIRLQIPLGSEARTRNEDIRWALDQTNDLFNKTEGVLINNLSPLDKMRQAPSQFWAVHAKSDLQARERSFPAFVALFAAKRIAKFIDEVPHGLHHDLEAICPRDTVQYCDNKKYRSFDGSCNNVANPMWGATYAPMQRFIPADYADSVSALRSSKIPGEALPNVRFLSTALFREPDERQRYVTALVREWAHFVYTDLVHIGQVQLSVGDRQFPVPCCMEAPIRHPECASIRIPKTDPRLGDFVDCMPYTRSVIAPLEGCPLAPREQANLVTSFLDGSNIYGSTNEKMRQLRTFRDGQLLTSTRTAFDEIFPPILDPLKTTFSTICAPSAAHTCFISGSEHVNFLPTTAALHTIWIRQHNRVANQLLTINKQWTDEQLFQEARRIVVAQMQHITYNEFLPLLVGRESWKLYGLNPKESYGESDSYDLGIDSSVLNTYAAVVGQFFYTLMDEKIVEYNKQGTRIPGRPLSEFFNDPSSLVFAGKMDGILRALIRETPPKVGVQMVEELREKLFKSHNNFGLDLASLILQTGRDHGIPSYTVWREKCGGKKVSSFADLVNDVQNPSWLLPVLEKNFAAVEDVDLFLLGLAEKPVRGALVGPTFSCILSLQFRKTKKGDRFWYENSFQPGSFTEDQQMEIKKTTFGKILCDNTGLGSVQPRVFETPDLYDNFPLACNSTMLGGPNLEVHWRDASPHIEMPVTMATIRKAIKLAMLEVEERRKREANNIRLYQGEFQSGDPIYSYGKMMRPKREASEVARMSAVLLESTKILLSGHPELLDNKVPLPLKLDTPTLQRILPTIDVSSFVNNFTAFLGNGGTIEKCLPRDLPCDHTSPYRTYSGWCNNLRFPHFGNAFGPLKHLLPPVYEDGVDEPRKFAKSGQPLPSPRIISNAIHLDLPIDHSKMTHMVMQFGQILDHEMTHSPVERGPNDEILNCSRCDSRETLSVHCMPLPVPEGDPHFPTHYEDGERRCLPFARSLLGQLTLGYRNQINQLTAFLDGSAIYGSTTCEAFELRSFQGGRLNFTDLGPVNHEALPQGDQGQDCRGTPRFPCFNAGDERNSHQPGLLTIHNIFLREHNRIARQLEVLNPLWSDEKIYQETRKIVGAMFQHIVYNEYLPKLIGNELVASKGLVPLKSGHFSGYDPMCDASISHPFATAAFRFGHTLVRRMFPRMNSFYRNHTSPVDLVQNFNNMEAVYDKDGGGIDSILVGLLGTPSMAFDRHITNALRNHLFGRRGEPLSGMDLISINILRARDHGVQPYNAFRELCNLGRAYSFSDLASEMDRDAIAALEAVYESVDDIDLFPGLLSERPMPGAIMPPTMACIIAEQFQRLKKCDRFYYENDLAETKFSIEQLQEIRKIRLGSILCQNSAALLKIQPDVFSMPNEVNNAQIPCTDFPRMDLTKWMDRGVCIVGNKELPKGSSTRKSPCVSCTCTNDGPRCKTMIVGNCQTLLNKYLFTDIVQDMACIVQCSKLIRERAGRL